MANCKIPCYVLEDGTRVLSGRQIQTALKLTDDMPSSQSAGSRLQRYLNQKSLHPHLYKSIYNELPDGIAEELKKKVPTSKSGNKLARYFQFLTDDYGSPHLKAQINKIITIFNMSDNMEDMWKNFEKAKSRQMNYLEPPYKFDENGHTVEEGDDLLETPKPQIITETFAAYTPSDNKNNENNNME